MKDDREFWLQVRRGLLIVVSAIESRWGFPRTAGGATLTPLGQKYAAPERAPHAHEPPVNPPAQ